MAEIQLKDGKSGKIRARKMSAHVDLTPMVDLGFLLITFFMLTTTLAKPQIMAMVMPDRKDTQPQRESKILTLLLGAGDKVYWYEGISDARLDSTGYGSDGIRRVILGKMKKVQANLGLEDYPDPHTGTLKKGSFLNVIIKATPEARYKNLVDALDEMAICNIRYYVILDISDVETDFIKKPSAGLDFEPDAQRKAAMQ